MRRVQQNEVTKSSAREIDAEKVELVTKAGELLSEASVLLALQFRVSRTLLGTGE